MLETSYFWAVSTQVVHTSSLLPNLSFPLIHPNHPLGGKKEKKMAKMFGGKKTNTKQKTPKQTKPKNNKQTNKQIKKRYFSILVFRVGCDAQVAKLTGANIPQVPKSCHPTASPEEGVTRLPAPQFLHSWAADPRPLFPAGMSVPDVLFCRSNRPDLANTREDGLGIFISSRCCEPARKASYGHRHHGHH